MQTYPKVGSMMDYTFDQHLSIGVFSTVDLVRRNSDGQLFVRKQFTGDKVRNRKAYELFERESDELKTLSDKLLKHEEFRKQYDAKLIATYIERQEDALFMTYVGGETLQQYLDKNIKLSLEEIWDLLVRLLDFTSFLHGQDYVHRDIKPANIVVDINKNTGRLSDKHTLIDFGSVANLSYCNGPSTKIYSQGYACEAQKKGEPVEFYFDYYAVAMIVLQCFTGQTPPQFVKPFPDYVDWVHPDLKSIDENLKHIVRKLLAVPSNLFSSGSTESSQKLKQKILSIKKTVLVSPGYSDTEPPITSLVNTFPHNKSIPFALCLMVGILGLGILIPFSVSYWFTQARVREPNVPELQEDEFQDIEEDSPQLQPSISPEPEPTNTNGTPPLFRRPKKHQQ